MLEHLGEYPEAERLRRHILESRLRVLGEEHELALQAMNNLGLLLWKDGRAKEAEPLLQRAVQVHRRIFDDEYLVAMGNLALALSTQGKLAEAEPLYRALLKSARTRQDDVYLAQTLGNLAWHYLDMGKPAEAEPMFREALDLRRRVHGETHPQIVFATDSLAIALQRMGQFDEGEQLLRQTLETVRDQLGNEHPTTLLYES